MHKLKVGYLPLVKGSWINDSLEGRRQAALRALADLGVEIVEGGRLVQSETEAAELGRAFAAAQVDVVLAHFITFALGSIVPG
ncbi:MAG: hypothetical protein ABR497_10315, partial [Kiritimatiellia bacterium]